MGNHSSLRLSALCSSYQCLVFSLQSTSSYDIHIQMIVKYITCCCPLPLLPSVFNSPNPPFSLCDLEISTVSDSKYEPFYFGFPLKFYIVHIFRSYKFQHSSPEPHIWCLVSCLFLKKLSNIHFHTGGVILHSSSAHLFFCF